MSTLFIGYTRFSVHQYESGSFNATRKSGGFTHQEYTDWLYDAQRLGTRTEIFLQESLPQLHDAAQGHELVHIVTISPSLPDEYKAALQQARSQYGFLRIHETKKRAAPSHPNLQLVKKMLTKRGLQGKTFGMYRLDDDDILPLDYFQRMAAYVSDEHVGYRVSLPQGIGAIRAQDGYIFPWSFYEAKSSAGFLTVHKFSPDGQKIYGLEARHHLKGHQRADRNFPVILDGRAPGFFRARHETQDSTLSASPRPFYTPVVHQTLTRPAADRQDITSYFPHVSEHIWDPAGHLPGAETLVDAPVPLHTGHQFSCRYQEPILLTGQLNSTQNDDAVELGITVDQSAPENSAGFLKAAGFSQVTDTRFVRQLHCDGEQISDVLEPAEGMSITGFDLSGAPESTLVSLFAAPLKKPGL